MYHREEMKQRVQRIHPDLGLLFQPGRYDYRTSVLCSIDGPTVQLIVTMRIDRFDPGQVGQDKYERLFQQLATDPRVGAESVKPLFEQQLEILKSIVDARVPPALAELCELHNVEQVLRGMLKTTHQDTVLVGSSMVDTLSGERLDTP
jgi:hypothetical protein